MKEKGAKIAAVTVVSKYLLVNFYLFFLLCVFEVPIEAFSVPRPSVCFLKC